jgi:hypothetical protein
MLRHHADMVEVDGLRALPWGAWGHKPKKPASKPAAKGTTKRQPKSAGWGDCDLGKIKLYKWDMLDYLDHEEDIADFLADLLADNDDAMTRSALDTARRARIRLGLPAVDPEVDIARAILKGSAA